MWINRHKTLATAIGIFALSAILLLLAVVPIFRNANSLLGKIKTKSSELDSLTNKVSILGQLDKNVLTERVKVLDSALPPKKDILLYLNSIDGLSRELGLTFGGLSLTPGDITEASGSAKTTSSAVANKTTTKTPGGLQSLETEIKVSGGQDNIYSFLRTIENVLPLMQIKDIKVSVLGSDQYSLTLTLGMLWAEPVTGNVNGPITLFGADEDKYFSQLSEYRTFESGPLPDLNNSGKTDLFSPYSVGTINVIETAPISSASPSATTN